MSSLEGDKDLILGNTWAEINLDSIDHNFTKARDMVAKETKIAGVIKANAYGHGAIMVAGQLIESGVDYLAVASLVEAIELRRAYASIPILVMGYTGDEKLSYGIANDITLTIYSYEQAKIISDLAVEGNKQGLIHIKLETGFHRLGLDIDEDTIDTIRKIYNLPNIYLEGIFTHFSLTNREEDTKQFNLLMDIVDELKKVNIEIPIKHICDAIAMVKYPEFHLDMIRLGSFMYGVEPSSMEKGTLKLAMTLKTKISQINHIKPGDGVGYGYSYRAVEDRLIGTIPTGYADGYLRLLSGIGEASIKGSRAKIVGKICMDQMMLDISNVDEAKVGDEVILLGGDGENYIALEEVADRAATNKNEILSIVSRRVPRVYIKNSELIKIVDYILD